MPKFSHYVCKRKELWVGFYDHDCCEFVWPFIPLFVLMTMVVVVNCVMIHSIVCCCVVDDNCCCELCDDDSKLCCFVMMMLFWIVWQFVPLLLLLLLWVVWWLIDPKCCWCLLLWIVWWWFIHSALVDGCLFSCCWRTNKPKGVPAQLPKGTAFGLFVEEFQDNLCLFPEAFSPFPCWRNVGTSFVCWRNAGTSFVVCWRMQNFVLLILASVEVVSLSGCLHEALMAGQRHYVTSVSSASPAACYYAMD